MEPRTEPPSPGHPWDRPIVPTSEMLGDDAEVELKRKVPDALVFADDEFVPALLRNLNAMRKNNQFCDVILQVGKQEIAGHHCVLAGSSQYLLKLFGDEHRQLTCDEAAVKSSAPRRQEPVVYKLSDKLDGEATEALVQFAYTGKLSAHPSRVRSVYSAAVRLKMDKVAAACAQWLVNNLDIHSCLEIRAIPGIVADTQLVKVIDEFIVRHFAEMVSTKQMMKLPQVKVELLTPALEEVTSINMATQALLVLDWLRKFMVEENMTLQESTEKLHLLYMNIDQSLHDCSDIVSGDSANTEMVQDYKKLSKKTGRKQSPAIQQHSGGGSNGHYHTITYSSERAEAIRDEECDWKTLACSKVDERGMVSLVTVAGTLAVLSVRQRLNAPSPTGSPRSSRPPSMEKPDSYGMLPELACAKCSVGAGNLNNQLIICGGYDRGECLREVEIYDPVTNQIRACRPMLAARGRFDLTVVDGRVYAVGGCDGNNELASVECYQPQLDKWSPRSSLHMARSNQGVCALNGKICCIGGWNGKFGSRKCEMYDPATNKWTPMASLNVGRYQAAVTVLNGLVYAVGGCDSWNCLSSVEVYDPVRDAWSFVTPMSTPRRGSGVSRVNGKLIVVGGLDGVQSLNTTELYDPVEDKWTSGPKMLTRRANVNVAVVDGKLFAVGGFSGKQFLNTMEFLDPRTMSWSALLPRRNRGISSGSATSEEECPEAVTAATRDFSPEATPPPAAPAPAPAPAGSCTPPSEPEPSERSAAAEPAAAAETCA
ncbi:influenza virus NS1A-binding protein homolog isoform X1 [Amphibalanus amphitrite]|uniref:influenza virus NS1A-binding protein homolog isoform X1 n=2 Tax=Amphibalanus amphitrite TaxID=1232801 RepID=UPI001C912D44|nr:influenza virus NS1A-binding protein homolog isoform X1 [Amphibalanus amphitrite]